MTCAVRFYTRSGNTKKLAEAVAEGAGVAALSVETPLEEKVDILFLGSSYYAFDMDAAVKDFLKANKDKIGKLVLFGSSAMMKSMKKPMQKVTDELGITIAEEEFHVRGEFGPMHKGKPDANDVAAAKEFAAKVIA